MKNEMPSFEEAVAKFQWFLQKGGHSSCLRWVFREDVLEWSRKIFVRIPLLNSDAEAKRLYDEGVERDLGVHLDVYCFLDAVPLVYVWLPKDEEDASYRMLDGLKLSYPVGDELRKVVGVRSRIGWNCLRLLERCNTRHKWAEGIPCREAVARDEPTGRL